MSCWVCDSGDTGGSLGTYYFDEDFLTQGQISFNFCTNAFDSNTVNITFSSDLYLEGRLYDSNVNGGVLSPGAHSPRRYTATLDTVYGVCGYGEHSFEYATSWYDEYWNSGSSSSSISFVLKPVRVFLFHNDGDYEADLYQEYTIGGATVSAEDYYIMAVKKDGTADSTTVNGGGYLFVFDGGTASNTTVASNGLMTVYAGATITNCTVNGGGVMTLNAGTELNGNVVIGGAVTVVGSLDADSSYSLTFDIPGHDPETSFLSGYQFLNNDQISSVSISVSGGTPEEGKYILIDDFDISSPHLFEQFNNLLGDISFTVDRQKQHENYAGQYTFKWNADEGKYSGINYNGYNYVLSTENNQLSLSVKKNVQTLFILLQLGSKRNFYGGGSLDEAKRDQILQSNPELNDINICVALDASKSTGKQADYYIVGSGASTECSGFRSLSDLSGLSDILSDHASDSVSLFVCAHGSGMGFAGKSIDNIASTIKNSGSTIKIKNLIFGPCCLNCSFEVAYALKDTGIVNIIGSEQSMLANTFDYDVFLDALKKNQNGSDTENIASIAFDTLEFSRLWNFTKSWLKADSTALSNLLEKMNEFASQVKNFVQTPKDWNKIVKAKEHSEVYENSLKVKFLGHFTLTQVDLYQFMDEVSKEFKSIDDIRNICNEIKGILTKNGDIVHDFSQDRASSFHGISVYMPTIGRFYEGSYPESLLKEEWGRFVQSLHYYATHNSLPENKTDRSLGGVALTDGENAADTGELTCNVVFAGETAWGEDESDFYAVSLTAAGTANDGITVVADSGATLTLNVYDATGTTLLQTASGTGRATVSLNDLDAGTYVYSVSADQMTSFDIAYQTSVDTGNDHLDLLSETGNNTKETALTLGDGYFKGLVASSVNPDWYLVETYDAAPGMVGLWGDGVVSGSVSASAGEADFHAYIDDAFTKEKTAFTWDAKAGMYVAFYSGAGYLYIEGNGSASKGYNLLCTSVFEDDFTGTTGDLNADGRADVLMAHDAGFTGAWLVQSDQTAAWGDLSTLNPGWEIFGTGRTAPGKETADVYVRSTDNVIGAWTTGDSGQVTGWETVGQFGSDTQVLGLGDFNGNGQTDLLLRNVNGAVGCYFTDGTGWNYFQSLGDEWQIAAIGDFNGDDRADTVLVHDAGFAGTWLTQSDGTIVWADLDTVSEGFAVAGAGDFDGDGTDDVLLRNGNYYGAWLVEDGSAKAWFGLGDLGNVTVEQIADFDGDGTDDLRIRTDSGDIGALLVRGEGALDWHYYGSVGDEWNTRLAAI